MWIKYINLIAYVEYFWAIRQNVPVNNFERLHVWTFLDATSNTPIVPIIYYNCI